MNLVTNHWGWSPRGIWIWLTCWAWPIKMWGVEEGTIGGCGSPRVYQRRVKIGPVCFSLGRYVNER